MGLYSRFILPRVVNLVCAAKPAAKQRAKTVPLAQGSVLEIGIGSGLNLPFYDPSRVERITGLDPSPEMWQLARERAEAAELPVEYVEGDAADMPLDRASFDTVLVTYTLCTIPDVAGALAEVRRVLRPGGELVFCEHGRSPDPGVRRWQERLNPIWRRMGGGCELDRPIPSLLEDGGFTLHGLETGYIPGLKPASFNFWGRATAR